MMRPSTFLLLAGLSALTGPVAAQSVSFASYAAYPMGPPCGPSAVAVVDINGDRKPDILTANSYNNTVGVLLNTGTGTFPAAATLYAAGGISASTGGLATTGIAVADLDGDGNPDVVMANSGSNTVSVLKGSGTGTLQAPLTYSTGSNSQPCSVVLADMNGDGHPDLLTPNKNSTKVGVLLGNSNGTFQPVVEYATGTASGPQRLAAADVNNDGYLDVVTANATNAVKILLGNGNGTLQAATTYTTTLATVTSIAVADVTGDGQADLLLAGSTSAPAGAVGVLPGNGNGTFQPGSLYLSAGGPPSRIVVADLNQDGVLDLVTPNVDDRVSNLASNSLNVFLGSGNGIFKPAVAYGVGGKYQPLDVAVADVNADGRPDLICAHYQANWMVVFGNTTPLAARATLPGTSATLHPNPASAATTLSLAGLPATVTQVQAMLLDATGRAVGQQQLAAAQGTARAEVPTAGLAAGFYVLRLVAYTAQGQPAGSLPAQHLSVR